MARSILLFKLSFILLSNFVSFNLTAQVDTIHLPSGYSYFQLRSNILRVSPDNHIWIGFSHLGVGEHDGNSWNIIDRTDGLPSNRVYAIEFDGTVKWIGTDSGLVRMDGSNLMTFRKSNSQIPSDRINYLYKSDTTLWIATDKGIASFNGSGWTVYDSTNSPLASNNVQSISETDFGIYVSTLNNMVVLTSSGWKNMNAWANTGNRLIKGPNNKLYASSSYQFSDTTVSRLSVKSDPCRYNTLSPRNDCQVIGVNSKNNLIVISSDSYCEYDVIFELDDTRDPRNIFQAPLFDNSCPLSGILSYTQLFDINRFDELIYTPANGIGPIYAIKLDQLSPLQPPESCPYLDINKVVARVNNNGSMFSDISGKALYEVPKESGKSPIFTEGLWIGGKDPQGKLHIAAQTYRQSGDDFWPGPLDTINATSNTAIYNKYNKVWKINRSTVNEFIQNFEDGSVGRGTYDIPDIILNWPAHGSGNLSRSLAPFIDCNSDGVYNPLQGDYPDIKGDQMLWWVFNDNYASHGNTRSLYNLGVEIHGSAYAYNCQQATDADSVINYTTFYHYDFINRSDTDYHDVYLGIFNDVDLGYYLDDYIGCDTLLDIAFAYNGDNYDDAADLVGYGLNPPMINLALLRGPKPEPGDGLDNNHNGVIDEPNEFCMMNYFFNYYKDFTILGAPVTPNQYYLRMQGRWLDSSSITYGGIGAYSSTIPTNYMLSGQPYDSTGWSENFPCSGCVPNTPSERRIFISSGPFQLPSREKRSLDFAYIYTREPDSPNGPGTSFAVNQEQVIKIKNFFETNNFPCNSETEGCKKDSLGFDILLFPNPAHSEVSIYFENKPEEPLYFSVIDVLGRLVVDETEVQEALVRLNLSSFSSGLYFVRTTGAINITRKFIVDGQ